MKILGSVFLLNGILFIVVEINCDVIWMFRMKIKVYYFIFCFIYVFDKYKVNVLVIIVEGKMNVEMD